MSCFNRALLIALSADILIHCGAAEVSRAPKILDLTDKLNYPESTNATLVCSIGSGELDGLTYEWLRDDKTVVSSTRYRISIAPDNFNSILRVIDLKPEDTGAYSCVARNEFGTDKITIKLQVKVVLKWIAEPKGELKVPVGKPLHVPCSADGQPAPTVTWTKLRGAGQLRQIGSELRFNAIGQPDSGVYECRAKTGVEEDLVARIKIDVLGEYGNLIQLK